MPPSRVVAAGAPRPPNGGAPRQNTVGVVASIAYKPKFKASPALHVAVRWPPSKLPKVKAYRSGQFAPDDVDSLDSLGSHEALMKVSKQPPDMLSPQSAIVRSAKAKPTASSATAAATGSSSSGAAVALNGSSPVSSRRGSSSSMAHKGRPSPTTQQQRDPSPVASSANSHGTALVLGSSEPGPRQDPAGSADASMQLTDNSSTAALAADAGTADAGTAAPKESVAVRPNLRRQDSRMSRDNAQSFKRSKGRLALTSPSPSLAEAVPDGSVTVHFRFGVVEQKRGFGGVWPFGQSVRAVAHLVPRELQFEFLTGAWPKPPVEMHSPVVTEDEALKKLLASEEDIEHPSVEPHDGAMSSSISGSASFSIDDPRARDLSAELRRAIHKCGMPRVMDLFRRFDVDGSGKIDNKEFRKAMQALELAWPVEDMDLLYRSVDRDGSGSIEYKELNKLLRQGADVQLEAALKPGAQVGLRVDQSASEPGHGDAVIGALTSGSARSTPSAAVMTVLATPVRSRLRISEGGDADGVAQLPVELAYRMHTPNRQLAISKAPSELPARPKLPGNLGFRGLAQVLLDHGVRSADLYTASTKLELFAIAKVQGVDLSVDQRVSTTDSTTGPKPRHAPGEAGAPLRQSPVLPGASRAFRYNQGQSRPLKTSELPQRGQGAMQGVGLPRASKIISTTELKREKRVARFRLHQQLAAHDVYLRQQAAVEAATVFQAMWRARLARRRVRQLRRARKAYLRNLQIESALKLQTSWRRRQKRKTEPSFADIVFTLKHGRTRALVSSLIDDLITESVLKVRRSQMMLRVEHLLGAADARPARYAPHSSTPGAKMLSRREPHRTPSPLPEASAMRASASEPSASSVPAAEAPGTAPNDLVADTHSSADAPIHSKPSIRAGLGESTSAVSTPLSAVLCAADGPAEHDQVRLGGDKKLLLRATASLWLDFLGAHPSIDSRLESGTPSWNDVVVWAMWLFSRRRPKLQGGAQGGAHGGAPSRFDRTQQPPSREIQDLEGELLAAKAQHEVLKGILEQNERALDEAHKQDSMASVDLMTRSNSVTAAQKQKALDTLSVEMTKLAATKAQLAAASQRVTSLLGVLSSVPMQKLRADELADELRRELARAAVTTGVAATAMAARQDIEQHLKLAEAHVLKALYPGMLKMARGEWRLYWARIRKAVERCFTRNARQAWADVAAAGARSRAMRDGLSSARQQQAASSAIKLISTELQQAGGGLTGEARWRRPAPHAR